MDVSQTEIDELFEQMALNGLDFIKQAIEELGKAKAFQEEIQSKGPYLLLETVSEKIKKLIYFDDLEKDSESEEIDRKLLADTLIQRTLKYSVIHFGSGVEVLLKARLLKADWKQVTTYEEPDFTKLKNGELETITMERAIKRLRKHLGNMPNDINKSLKRIRDHRNQAIHFRPSEQIEDVAIEQYKALDILLKLLTEDWGSEFGIFKVDIELIRDDLSLHEYYIDKRFDEVSCQVDKVKENTLKYIVTECVLCSREAVIINKLNTPQNGYFTGSCLICNNVNAVHLIKCPECSLITLIHLLDQPPTTCKECSYMFSPIDLHNSGISIHSLVIRDLFSPPILLAKLKQDPQQQYRDCKNCNHPSGSSLYDKNMHCWICTMCKKLEFVTDHNTPHVQ